MELLKNIPGISVKKREVQPSPPGRYSNVTELNVLYPFSHKSPSTSYQHPQSVRFGHRINSTSLQLRPEHLPNGTTVAMPISDPRSILKRPKHRSTFNRIFLDYNAAQAHSSSPSSAALGMKQGRNLDPRRSHQDLPKGPSKNVTFNLDNDHLQPKTADQWAVGISRVSRPILIKRRVTFKDQRSQNCSRENASQKDRRIYYLPLLLKGKSNRRKMVIPSTADPASQRTRPEVASSISTLDDDGKARVRSMADEYRRTLNLKHISLSKT